MIIARTVFGTLLLSSLIAGSSCGSPPSKSPGGETTHVAALVSDGGARINSSKAVYYAGQVRRYRDVASEQRRLSAAYAHRTPPATTTKDWNAILKARADARAAAADQIAARTQTIADFHTAKAATELGR